MKYLITLIQALDKGFFVAYGYSFLEPPVHQPPSGNPCVPSPCGPNSQCRAIGNTPACSCLPNYLGRAPTCRPECTISAECPGNLACQNEQCRDPCPGSCGSFTTCVVVKHAPMCYCETGYTGDPFTGCSQIQQSKQPMYLWIFQIKILQCEQNHVCPQSI